MNLAYVGLSSALTALVVAHTYVQKEQFYPTVVQITRSSGSMMVMYNMALVLVVLFGKIMQRLFFGQLRAIEVEHLYERSWYAVTETCLAMSIFRDEFNSNFVVFFTVLLFLKIFHWLAQDRVDFMEQSPGVSWPFYSRTVAVITVLAVLDAWFVYHAVTYSLVKGPSMQLLFGFEFIVLSTMLVTTFFKFIMHTIDLQSEHPWDNKPTYVFYLELTMDFVRLIVYVLFFAIVYKYYGMPLHIVRDLYMTFRSFVKRVNDFFQYRRATANMNQRYPDATREELASVDNTCIICREEMTSAKRLPCGHVFHLHCLRSWLERQQTCPTCRAPVIQDAARATPSVGANAAANATPAVGTNAGSNAGAGVQVPSAAALGGVPSVQWTLPPGMGVPFPPPLAMQDGTPVAPPFVGFPPPFLPFSFLPPMNAEHLAPLQPLEELGEDELRAMEGREREHLARRIKFLREMQSHVSGIIARYAQYESLIASLPPPPVPIATPHVPTTDASGSGLSEPRDAPVHGAEGTRADNEDVPDVEGVRQRRMERFGAGRGL
eukprot:Opistho-2@89580